MRSLLKALWYKVTDMPPSALIGSMFSKLTPRRCVNSIQENMFTIKEPECFFAKCIRNYIEYKYYTSNDANQAKENREKYWGGTAGKKWHESLKEVHVQKGMLSQDYLQFMESIPMMAQLTKFINHEPNDGNEWTVVGDPECN